MSEKHPEELSAALAMAEGIRNRLVRAIQT
jgi:hypothetical protein